MTTTHTEGSIASIVDALARNFARPWHGKELRLPSALTAEENSAVVQQVADLIEGKWHYETHAMPVQTQIGLPAETMHVWTIVHPDGRAMRLTRFTTP